MCKKSTINERWEKLSDEAKSSIKSLHAAAQALVDGLDALASAREAAKTPYAEETIIRLIDNLNSQLESVEYRLQDLWGFEKNANYHTWWLRPKNCKCPKLDNQDPAYYGGGKIITEECPIHSYQLIKGVEK